jgi:C1A family cysteine protease
MNQLADELPSERARRIGATRKAAQAVHAERLAEAGIQEQPVLPAQGTITANPGEVLPPSFTWKGTGQVGPVRDQSTCGSCFAFAASQAFTGAYYRATNQTVEFSVQAALDCSWPWGNDACNGGLPHQVYSWVTSSGGWPTKASYPYLGQNGFCHDSKPGLDKPATVAGYFNVTAGDDTAMKTAIANFGPVAVSIDAALADFDYYTSGVYDDPACKSDPDDLDHSVLAVGYDDDKGAWLIQNSWSTHWGDEGMVWIKYGLCGVNQQGTVPTADAM